MQLLGTELLVYQGLPVEYSCSLHPEPLMIRKDFTVQYLCPEYHMIIVLL